jgi:hypothetical protein
MRGVLSRLALTLPALVGCVDNPSVTNAEAAEFQQVADAFQQLYTGGAENCEGIISRVAEDVTLVENGETWGHAQLEEFCPHLPKKNVVDIWSDRTVISPRLAYDFVTLVYENEPGVARRETMVRVWRKTADEWKVIRMSSVLGPTTLENPGR